MGKNTLGESGTHGRAKKTDFENSYFWAKSKAIGFAFWAKKTDFENSYLRAKSKTIGFAFWAKIPWVSLVPMVGQKRPTLKIPIFGQKVRL